MQKSDLENFLTVCNENLSCIQGRLPHFVLVGDRNLDSLAQALANNRHVNALQCFLQAHASLRAALVTSAIGLNKSAFPTFRQSIEFSAHCMLVRFDHDFKTCWLAENPSAKQKNTLRRWKQRFRKLVEKVDEDLWHLFNKRYQDWIDLGAHPSKLGLRLVFAYNFEDDSDIGQMQFSIIGDATLQKMNLFSFGCAVAILDMVFQNCWTEIYSQHDGETLRKEFSSSFKKWCANAGLLSVG